MVIVDVLVRNLAIYVPQPNCPICPSLSLLPVASGHQDWTLGAATEYITVNG